MYIKYFEEGKQDIQTKTFENERQYEQWLDEHEDSVSVIKVKY